MTSVAVCIRRGDGCETASCLRIRLADHVALVADRSLSFLVPVSICSQLCLCVCSLLALVVLFTALNLWVGQSLLNLSTLSTSLPIEQ